MEDRRTRARKRLAGVREGIRDLRSPIDREPKSGGVTRPAVKCYVKGVQPAYQPGDLLLCSYTLDKKTDAVMHALETSVIWLTSGKGQEDIGVHFFERREKRDLEALDQEVTQKLTVRLPKTPLSYDGQIVKIHWCVRIRIFLDDGNQLNFDEAFRLGSVGIVEKKELE